MVTVTLITGIIFSYSLACNFRCRKFYEGGPHVHLPPTKCEISGSHCGEYEFRVFWDVAS
jgi:hypothetical protein